MINKYFSLMTTHAVLLLIGLAEAIRELMIVITSTNMGFDSFLIDFANKANTYNIIVIAVNVLTIIALVFSLIYMYKEYKKSAHVSYKIFLYLYLVIWIFETIAAFVFVDAMTINRILFILVLIVLFVLACGKNLGEKKSKVLGAALIVLSICIAIFVLLKFVNDKNPIPIVINIFSGYLLYILLSSTTYIMIVGKYIDKASRGAE